MPEWVPEDLPAAPGIYRFLGERGELLYIGKSVNLRRRVRGYFYGGGPKGRLADLAVLARGVEHHRTGSDLEARLLEARAILEHRPRFNRAIKNRWRGWYLEIDESEPFPRPRVVRSARRPSAHYFGPYAGRFLPLEIARLLEDLFGLRSCAGPIRPDVNGRACIRQEIGTCGAPCVGSEGLNDYRRRVRDAIRVLADRDRAARLRSHLSEPSTDGGRARAGTATRPGRRKLAWLEELEAYRSVLQRPSRQRSLLAILPHHETEQRVLLPVALGRVLSLRAARPRSEHWQRSVADACYAVRVSELRAELVLEPDEMVTSLIVRRWLETGAPDGTVYDLSSMTDEAVLLATGAGQCREINPSANGSRRPASLRKANLRRDARSRPRSP